MPSKENETIAAVVVTYNRKELLVQCIEAALQQSVSLDRIYIIDNASTDGTEALVREKFKQEIISYVRLDTNTGSAGGFHEGVKRAYEAGSDWIWFLDDDIAPRTDCLAQLLLHNHIGHCLSPNKFDTRGEEFTGELLFDPSSARTTMLPNISFKHGKEYTFINVGCFEGLLIHRDIVSKIGYPDPRFFTAGDDTIYGFTASLFTNLVLVKSAVVDKLVPYNHRMRPIFFYYSVRNQLLIKEYLQKYGLFHPGIFYLYYGIFICYVCTKHALRLRSFAVISYALRGLVDGIQSRFYKIS